MKKNSKKAPAKGRLILGRIIEITDPAEQAALDRRCEEAEKILAARTSAGKPRKVKRSDE